MGVRVNEAIRTTETGNALPFIERQHVTSPVVLAVGAVALGLGSAAWTEIAAGTPPAAALRMAAFLVIVAAVGVVAMARLTGVQGRHLRVDGSGLKVGRRMVRADRIGEVRIVEPAQAAKYGLRRYVPRGDGQRLKLRRGQTTYAILGSSGPAVFVEERENGAWLLSSRDPEGLVTALTVARSGSHR